MAVTKLLMQQQVQPYNKTARCLRLHKSIWTITDFVERKYFFLLLRMGME